MKKGLKALGLLSLMLTLAACQGTSSLSSSSGAPSNSTSSSGGDSSSSSSSSPSSSSSTPDPVEETYRVLLSVPTGVSAHLDKEEAAEGETVTLTIDTIESGYSVTEVLLQSYSTTPLTSEDGKTYTFTMPDRSVTVVINIQVEGDITLVGDVIAALTLNPETGIYEARNVKVDVDTEMAYFSYQVKDAEGNTTRLDSSAVDEKKCFAGLQYYYTTDPNGYSLQIASGSTYDFFYDPASERPCYVKRVHVDVLPNNVDSLYNLFYGNIRSESTVMTDNLTSMDLTIREASENRLNHVTMQKYADNTTYMKVEDQFNDRDFYVYKHLDEERNLFSVVDSYATTMGSDDDTRESGRTDAAYSANYDIIESGESGRFERTRSEAEHELNTTAHQMRFIEETIMYSYRVGTSPDSVDEISYSNVSIASEETENGFKTVIDTTVEYDSQEGIYTSERHEGYVFDVVLGFSAKGELTSIDYEELHYTEDQWDFSAHAPLLGQEGMGSTAKSIEGTYVYDGTMEENLPSSEFNPEDYFIQSFETVHFYNPETEMPEDDGKNYLHYNDDVMVTGTDSDDEAEHVEVSYLPTTALDLWQYAPTESSDDSIITSTIYNTYNEMTCVGIGDATVTLTNHTKESGIRHDVDITVTATRKFHSFSLNGTTNPLVTSTTSANIYAGTTEAYDVIVTPDSAPCIYTATVDPAHAGILQVVSTANHQLVLSSPADADIAEPTEVLVQIDSDWADPEVPSLQDFYLSITVIPAQYSPLGDWTSTDDTSDTEIHFTSDEYQGDYNDYYYDSTPKTGTIVDNYGGQIDTYYFYYQFAHGALTATVYDMETTGTSFPFTVDVVTLELTYNAASDTVDCCMYYMEATEDWEADYYGIIGSIDEESYLLPITFERA